MTEWTRKRRPDEVPTPVAVAVSDFCRRAKAPATAVEVRDALSTVSEADDFRVKAVADGEPAASPLGPFAVIDLVHGAEPELAAQRQRTGYYEIVQQLIALRETPVAATVERPAPKATLP